MSYNPEPDGKLSFYDDMNKEQLLQELKYNRLLLAACVHRLGDEVSITDVELTIRDDSFLWTQIPGVNGYPVTLRYREGDDGSI